jgi:hypothetical protein
VVAVATFLAAVTVASLIVAAFVATTFAASALATFVAATFIAAALSAFVAATVVFLMAAAFFKDKAMRTTWNRDRPAIATVEFIPGRAGGRRCGNAFAAAQFITTWTARGRNRYAMATLKHIAGRAFRTVLVVAGAPTPVFAIAAAGQCQRAAHAQHEKAGREKCCEALLHNRSLGSRGGPADRAHRPQLHSIECKRVKRRASVAKHVGDMLEVIGETFVVM